jgi:hypothetical protein
MKTRYDITRAMCLLNPSMSFYFEIFEHALQYWKQALGLAPAARKRRATESLMARILSESVEVTHSDWAANTSTGSIQGRPAQTLQTALKPSENANTALHALESSTDIAGPQDGGASSGQPEVSPEVAGIEEAAEAAETGPMRPDKEETGTAVCDVTSTAAAALAAVARGAHRADAAQRESLVTVMEKRRFAGQDVEIARDVQVGTKSAELAQKRAAASRSSAGLDAALSNIAGKPLNSPML